MVNVATASSRQTTPSTTASAPASTAAPASALAPACVPALGSSTGLTAAEIAALALSLAHLGVGPQAATARRALRHLVGDLPGDDPADEVIAATLATLTEPLGDLTAGRARVIASAITERLVVRLHYVDAAGRLTVREVEPVTCLVHREHWYLVAWCRLRHGIRAFRFDRLMAVETTSSAARPHRAERYLPFQRRTAGVPVAAGQRSPR